MKILITTGIYPPKIGGPAQYAKNLREEFESLGHRVKVRTFTIEDGLPTGLRHLVFALKIFFDVLWSEKVLALDTFSVGLPSVFVAKILGRKIIIRTGGDFLWEQYVERTKNKILLREFYKTEIKNFTIKEKTIFFLTHWTLRNVDWLVFSTDWQRQIFISAYRINVSKTSIIENYYGVKESDFEPKSPEFVASARKSVLKNFDILERVFIKIRQRNPEAKLFLDNLPYGQFIERMAHSFAVVLVSLGDISPNVIMDAIRLNRPFICTKEVGIYDRIKEAGLFVDPQNEQEIEQAVQYLLTEEGYREAKLRVSSFDYTHTWQEITKEFIAIFKK